jgi:hypothetical protein
MRETCVNLEERFGRRYRIGWEANGATKHQWPKEEWPWLMELRCQRGKLYPWGGDFLQAWTDRRRTGAQLRALPCVIHAKGDDEGVVRFSVDHIEAVLAVLKPYRRRQLSEAQKKQQAERLAAFRFGKSAAVQSTKPALESTIASPRPTGTGGSHAV